MSAPATTPPLSPALRDRIAHAIGDGNTADTVVLAGHFAIFTAGSSATDLLDNPGAVTAHTDMVEFTRSTWTSALDVVSRPEHLAARMLVLVDDLQFVRPALPDRGARERLGAALSADYLRRTPTLPVFHARELENRGIPHSRVFKNDSARWLFSERELRHAAVERIRIAAANGAAGRLSANEDGSRILVHDSELGDHTLVHSGHTSCAGGYLELILRLHERGVRRLVALVPARCLGPVTLGAALAKSVFGATSLDVVNLTSSGRSGHEAERRSA